MVLELYEHLVEARTVGPTFYLDFPVEVAPLTRQHRSDPRLAEKWDLVAFGTEIATAYSELVDPAEQRRRLTEQSLLAAGGDAEAMQLDEDFLRALEYGMPPSGGMGMGIDRMIIMLTGAEHSRDGAVPAGQADPDPGPPRSRARGGRAPQADDADRAHEGAPVDRLDLHRLAEGRRVHHQAVAHIHADVADVGEEEDQVTRLELAAAGCAGPRSTGPR